MHIPNIQRPVKLYEKGSLTLHRQVGFSQEIIDFLDHMVWGTEETLYEHLETAKRVKNIKNPILITLRKNGELMAMVLFIQRQARFDDVSFKSYFSRYLAANPAIRGTGLVARGSALTMKLIRNDEKDPAIFYAAVEAKNHRSLRIVESVNYAKISRVRTLGFNRFFPRKNGHVQRARDPHTHKEILTKLEAFYKGHGFLNFDTLFIEDNYFVYRENGEIVAGIQVHKALWVISHMPGKLGDFIVKWAPRIPVIRRIINPKRFKFIALEGIYFQHKKMDQFFKLIEHAIAEFGVYSALWWLDERSPHYPHFRNSAKMGLLSKFVKDSDTLIMASFENMSEDQIELVKTMPTYVSSYDFI